MSDLSKLTNAELAARLLGKAKAEAVFAPGGEALLREAASRLHAPAVAEDGWQTIETAPCDGSDVLCGAWVRGIWRTGVSIVSSTGVANNWDWLTPATHWCHLPAPAALRTGGSE